MLREMLRAKVHRATVTETNVDYEGSLTLDEDLMKAAGMLPFERVDVYNSDSGTRFSTYLIPGKPGGGEVCINGAAALLATPGDRVIIASYAALTQEELETHKPIVVLLDSENRVKKVTDRTVAGALIG